MSLDPRSLAWATLAHKRLPQRALYTLLAELRDPQAVLDASPALLARHVPAEIAAAVRAPIPAAEIDATMRWLDDPAHHLVAWDDTDYPRALLDLGHAPPVVFLLGRRDLLNRPALAIVGSRNATPQGRATAREFAHALAETGLTIVSGLALGIDAAAHEGALGSAASTVAIIGTGPDRVYPARNRELARRIADTGAIITEFVPGTPPRKENFPRRNRLISGFARGVLVVEATLSSGSLITARWAGEQGRDVFAIPGSIHSPFARGCHKLIRDGAKLVETAEDVLVEQGLGAKNPPDPRAPLAPATGDEASLLASLGNDPVTIDALVERAGKPADVIAAGLVRLQLEGLVAALPGGLWQRGRAQSPNTTRASPSRRSVR
jgi:DNA processing protein